jgi:hypothetical protein
MGFESLHVKAYLPLLRSASLRVTMSSSSMKRGVGWWRRLLATFMVSSWLDKVLICSISHLDHVTNCSSTRCERIASCSSRVVSLRSCTIQKLAYIYIYIYFLRRVFFVPWHKNCWALIPIDAGWHSGFAIANNNRITTLLKLWFYRGIEAKGIKFNSLSVSYW